MDNENDDGFIVVEKENKPIERQYFTLSKEISNLSSEAANRLGVQPEATTCCLKIAYRVIGEPTIRFTPVTDVGQGYIFHRYDTSKGMTAWQAATPRVLRKLIKEGVLPKGRYNRSKTNPREFVFEPEANNKGKE